MQRMHECTAALLLARRSGNPTLVRRSVRSRVRVRGNVAGWRACTRPRNSGDDQSRKTTQNRQNPALQTGITTTAKPAFQGSIDASNTHCLRAAASQEHNQQNQALHQTSLPNFQQIPNLLTEEGIDDSPWAACTLCISEL